MGHQQLVPGEGRSVPHFTKTFAVPRNTSFDVCVWRSDASHFVLFGYMLTQSRGRLEVTLNTPGRTLPPFLIELRRKTANNDPVPLPSNHYVRLGQIVAAELTSSSFPHAILRASFEATNAQFTFEGNLTSTANFNGTISVINSALASTLLYPPKVGDTFNGLSTFTISVDYTYEIPGRNLAIKPPSSLAVEFTLAGLKTNANSQLLNVVRRPN